jgi:hypothetical protein
MEMHAGQEIDRTRPYLPSARRVDFIFPIVSGGTVSNFADGFGLSAFMAM